jgi:hypothetical protein
MSNYEILPPLDMTQSVHTNISIGMHRGVKCKISRIPLIGLVTRLGWRYRQKFIRNPNLNEITCFYASPSFCNLLPFFFLKVVCNINSWHYVYTYQTSRPKYLDISFHFNLLIWSGRQTKFMITSLFGRC